MRITGKKSHLKSDYRSSICGILAKLFDQISLIAFFQNKKKSLCFVDGGVLNIKLCNMFGMKKAGSKSHFCRSSTIIVWIDSSLESPI